MTGQVPAKCTQTPDMLTGDKVIFPHIAKSACQMPTKYFNTLAQAKINQDTLNVL